MPYNSHELIRVEDNRILRIADVLTFLKINKVDGSLHYEFQLSVGQHPITQPELQELTRLPYEVALTEARGIVFLNTGNEHDMTIGNREYEERRHRSKLSSHVHREQPDGRDESSVSFPDVLDTIFVSEGTPLLLVSPAGILKYHAPRYNPFTHQEFRGDILELSLKYIRTHAKNIPVMDIEEEIKISKQFARDTKMIEQKVLWNNTPEIQKMMDIINLTSQSLSPVTHG